MSPREDDDQVYGVSESQSSKIARLEERIRNLERLVDGNKIDSKELSKEAERVIEQKARDVRELLDRTADELKRTVLTKAEFEPVKKLVYGMVGFLLLSVGGMVISFMSKGFMLPPLGGIHP